MQRWLWLCVSWFGVAQAAECAWDEYECSPFFAVDEVPAWHWVDSPEVPVFPAPDDAVPLVELVIGVKTSVMHGKASRQAIRDTWGHPSTLPLGVRVVFLGCTPDYANLDDTQTGFLVSSIAAEQLHFNDLLVEELYDCRDAYDDLVNKVLAFFQWSSGRRATHAPKRFVMVTDDDIYLRVDALVALLQSPEISSSRFYGGQVWATHYQRPIVPYRNSVHSRYYLSHAHYRMAQLPPFANGPHYILSAEVAHFIGRHREFFRGVGGDPSNTESAGTLDDVSVALWLMGMQMHPQHISQFGNLRDTMCRNDYISFADLSTTALYRIHQNVAADRSFCAHFSYATWLKQTSLRGNEEREDETGSRERIWSSLTFSVSVTRATHVDQIALFLAIGVKDASSDTLATIEYYPSSVSYFTFCSEAARHVATTFSLLVHQGEFCRNLQALLLDRIRFSLDKTPSTHAMLALLLHNVAINDVAPTLKVAVTKGATYGIVVLENLLTQAYPGAEVQVFDESSMRMQDHGVPDIVVFSSPEEPLPESQIDYFIHKYAATSRLVLLHPREVSTSSPLDHRLTVITQSHSVQAEQQLYVPLVSMTFGACADHSPVDLLLPFARRKMHVTDGHSSTPLRIRQFCLDHYVLDECEQPHREYFYSLLDGLDRVDSVSPCPHHQLRMSLRNRTSPTQWANFLDLKTELFAHYKFTIAFENAVDVPGFVSDKIVSAFLAGSIPVYYGHSSTARHLFNPKAFIDCGSYPSLRACAAHVLAVHASPSLYESMRQEPPISNLTAFYEIFSWHPSVLDEVNITDRGASLSDKLRSILNSS